MKVVFLEDVEGVAQGARSRKSRGDSRGTTSFRSGSQCRQPAIPCSGSTA